VAAILAMSGCGGSGGSSSTTSSAGAGATTQSAGKAYVVLVTDINQLNDHGFNALAYKGLLKA
jgi:basic membrane lipoprotein Med (substrate-binding protein (PBP1-ABC) superfamily)